MFLQKISPFGKKIYAIGQIVIAANGQILDNNLPVWLHWQNTFATNRWSPIGNVIGASFTD